MSKSRSTILASSAVAALAASAYSAEAPPPETSGDSGAETPPPASHKDESPAPAQPAVEDPTRAPHEPTTPSLVGEGRTPILDASSAQAMAAANEAAGFPSPPIVEAALQVDLDTVTNTSAQSGAAN